MNMLRSEEDLGLIRILGNFFFIQRIERIEWENIQS